MHERMMYQFHTNAFFLLFPRAFMAINRKPPMRTTRRLMMMSVTTRTDRGKPFYLQRASESFI